MASKIEEKDVFEEAKKIADALKERPHDEARKVIALVACSFGLRLVGYSEQSH